MTFKQPRSPHFVGQFMGDYFHFHLGLRNILSDLRDSTNISGTFGDSKSKRETNQKDNFTQCVCVSQPRSKAPDL